MCPSRRAAEYDDLDESGRREIAATVNGFGLLNVIGTTLR
jgi:hypothetical protein